MASAEAPFLPLSRRPALELAQRHSDSRKLCRNRGHSDLKLPAESLRGPPGTCFPYISTMHVLVASEIILAPDSPMGFPWRLEQKS